MDTISLCAKYHNADPSAPPKEELNFYLAHAKKAKGKILNPLCETGRFLIPLAEKNLPIEGFDPNHEMVEILNTKCKDKNISPTLWQEDLEDLYAPSLYKLIMIPSSLFGQITDLEKAAYCLEAMYHALKEGGLLLFEAKTASRPPPYLTREHRRCSNGKMIMASSLSLGKCGEVDQISSRYELIDKGSVLQKEIKRFNLRLHKRSKLTEMLKAAGFDQIKAFRPPFKKKSEQSNSLMYACSKPITTT